MFYEICLKVVLESITIESVKNNIGVDYFVFYRSSKSGRLGSGHHLTILKISGLVGPTDLIRDSDADNYPE